MCLTNSNGREGQNKLGQIRKKQKEIEESKRKQRRKKVRKKDKKKKEERRGSENRQDEKMRTMYFGAKKTKENMQLHILVILLTSSGSPVCQKLSTRKGVHILTT